jgi:hypothetical protein
MSSCMLGRMAPRSWLRVARAAYIVPITATRVNVGIRQIDVHTAVLADVLEPGIGRAIKGVLWTSPLCSWLRRSLTFSVRYVMQPYMSVKYERRLYDLKVTGGCRRELKVRKILPGSGTAA